MQRLKKLLTDEQGATAVEYGLIVAAIAGLIVVVIYTLGNKVKNSFNKVATNMP
ncbi:MAG: Flp family type IVb pilin [Myxococcales bacterium]